MTNGDKIILDLCSGTGSWSKPYINAGYDVRLVTIPANDVRTYEPPENVYGILAAPPCTHFTVSGAQFWKAKDADGRTFEDVSIVTACLMIIARTAPKFFAIENPVGRMRNLLGDPDLVFNPCDYGDPYTKKTYLWGKFSKPELNPVDPIFYTYANGTKRGSYFFVKLGGKSARTKELRSITPPSFAQAFFKANK